MENFFSVYNKSTTNTLLAGNGFNLNFEHDTSYENIFERMRELDESCYDNNFEKKVKKNKYNLEKILNEPEYKHPLSKKAITMDFANALITIVKDSEYQKEYAATFVSKFDRIFTLNFDPFLYKIGLSMDKKSEGEYSKTILDYENRFNSLGFPEGKRFSDFSKTEKATLMSACREDRKSDFRKEAIIYFSDKSDDDNLDISWRMNDGFYKNGEKFMWRPGNKEQNVFYLHGSLHIYKREDDKIQKISLRKLGTLKERVVERIRSCIPLDIIFNNDNKMALIEKNSYMKYSLEELAKVRGDIYLYGVSLSENDNHIWDAVKSGKNIQNIYVSCSELDPDPVSLEERAQNLFGRKAKLFESII